MILSEFTIGREFMMDDKRYRCTDVGTRVVVAICVDPVTSTTFDAETGERRQETLSYDEANALGWFRGPPYGGLEMVFDEYDLPGCSVARST